MKVCQSCGNSCYDTELYCTTCGLALPNTLRCTYCAAPITNLDAKHCDNCGGLLVFDRYPKRMGLVHCTTCGKPKPPLADFCPNCGDDQSSHAAVILSEQEYTKPKRGITPKTIILIIAGVVFAPWFLVFILGFFTGVINIFIGPEDDYSYSYSNTHVVEDAPTSSSDYDTLLVDDLFEIGETLQVGDFIEITGVISARSNSYCDLAPVNLTTENRECTFRISADYDSDIGKYIGDQTTVGQTITFRVKVTDVFSNIGVAYGDAIEVIE